jgi:hypothetical protein
MPQGAHFWAHRGCEGDWALGGVTRVGFGAQSGGGGFCLTGILLGTVGLEYGVL